jgi:hypothetical protein
LLTTGFDHLMLLLLTFTVYLSSTAIGSKKEN